MQRAGNVFERPGSTVGELELLDCTVAAGRELVLDGDGLAGGRDGEDEVGAASGAGEADIGRVEVGEDQAIGIRVIVAIGLVVNDDVAADRTGVGVGIVAGPAEQGLVARSCGQGSDRHLIDRPGGAVSELELLDEIPAGTGGGELIADGDGLPGGCNSGDEVVAVLGTGDRDVGRVEVGEDQAIGI